ncbi:hypothetical protein RRG08_065659 [Elysia crispata]|uniref:Solute carrier organic anion transporter family member n=1 Tax=Elysia crispata TaxID=231223 RepID=A0AAE0ZDL8_9GAST|nr:hypothetical protein RRG08_065659 [Elysia crispata]
MTKSKIYLGDQDTEKENRTHFLLSKDGGFEDDDSMAVNQSWTTAESDDDYKDDCEDDIVCGIGAFRPPWLQRFKTIGWFTGLYGFAGLLTSALNVYVSSQITTLERYFNFSSTVSGFIMSCNDIGYLLTTLFMSYYSRRVHIPRGLGLSTFVFGLSGIICVLAFAISKDEQATSTVLNSHISSGNRSSGFKSFHQLCVNLTSAFNTTTEEKAVSETEGMSTSTKYLALSIIAVGMAVQGIAKSPRHSFLGTFVDDNVPKTQTTKYLGIMGGFGIFGPAIAFVLGGVFSRIYVTLEDPGISVRDPRWFGAWWLGFLVFGGAAIIAAVPIICFPRHLKGRRQLEGVESRKKGLAKNERSSAFLGYEFKGFLKSCGRLMTNPVYTLLVFGISVNLLGIGGYYSFAAKYLESQFTVPVFKANVTLGSLNMLSAALGSVVGGFVVSRLRLSPRMCIKFVLACTVLTSLVLSCSLMLGCDQPYIHTATDELKDEDLSVKECVAGCDCDTQNFFPVCGADNRNYFSPCHAGCTDVLGSNVFINCSCVVGNTARLRTEEMTEKLASDQTATAGLCIPDCDNFYPYLAIMFVHTLIACLTIMPNFVVYVRAVPEKDKPLALGFMAFLATVLGWLPGPIVFGYIVDTCCEIWNGKGACVLYNLSNFRFRFHITLLGLRSVLFVLLIIIFFIVTFSKTFEFQSHNDEEDISGDNKRLALDRESDMSIKLSSLQSHKKKKELEANGN